MARRAAGRDTYLTRDEISREAIRQLGERDSEPSIRSLSTALGVAPPAIYHHYASRAAIFQRAVELVWNEAAAEVARRVPLEADPADVLVTTGLITRRTWLAHHRLAPYMAATPEANEFTDSALGLMAFTFERLELAGEQAASAFHTYASFMIGAVLFAASRATFNNQLTRTPSHTQAPKPRPGRGARRTASDVTHRSINRVMDISVIDPARDEELFAHGLRLLVDALTGPVARPTHESSCSSATALVAALRLRSMPGSPASISTIAPS